MLGAAGQLWRRRLRSQYPWFRGREAICPGPFGSISFNLSTITRNDLMSLTEECEKVTGIPYVMRAYRKEAEKILAQ